MEKRVFRLIAAYSEWHTTFLEAQLEQNQEQIRMSN